MLKNIIDFKSFINESLFDEIYNHFEGNNEYDIPEELRQDIMDICLEIEDMGLQVQYYWQPPIRNPYSYRNFAAVIVYSDSYFPYGKIKDTIVRLADFLERSNYFVIVKDITTLGRAKKSSNKIGPELNPIIGTSNIHYLSHPDRNTQYQIEIFPGLEHLMIKP